MKVLVTGANGFIGSALCPYLRLFGHNVIPSVRQSDKKKFELVRNDARFWDAALMDCDSIIHLAAVTHCTNYLKFNQKSIFHNVNVQMTKELAKKAIKYRVRRLVFLSTIKVNGENTAPGFSFKDSDQPNPQDLYAHSKWEAESELFKLAINTGLEIVVIRSPLVYGPGVKGNFASLIKLIKSGVPLPFGGLSNSRSMIALDNLVSFIALCADKNLSPNAKSQIFLVSDGEDVSTVELLHRIAKAYQCKNRMFTVRVELMRHIAQWMGIGFYAERLLGSLILDNSKAQEILGWKPIISMDEQLRKMAIYDAVY